MMWRVTAPTSRPPGPGWSRRGSPRARTGPRARRCCGGRSTRACTRSTCPRRARWRSARAGAARSPWSGSRARSTRPATSPTTSRRPSAAPSRSTTSAGAAGGRCATRASTSTCGGTGRSTSTRPTSPRPPPTRWCTTCSTAGTAGCCRSPGGRRATDALAVPTPPRRACLFAMYDPDGLVDDYVVAYVAELARHADVFVLRRRRRCEPGQLDRLSGRAPARGCARTAATTSARGACWPGSWSAGTALAAYDEVLLANDSCWLLRPLDEVFARDGRPAVRLLGAAAHRPPVRAGAVASRSRCRSRR